MGIWSFSMIYLLAMSVVLAQERRELSIQRKLTSSSIDVVNYMGTQYMVELTIDGHAYSVQLDTGSADLWVACTYVSPSTCQSTCPSEGITITYGSGNVCVVPNTGSITLGSLSFNAGVYGIGMSTSALGNTTQGILGLAFPGLSSYGKFANQSAYTVLHLESFSMYLTAKADATGSKLVLNGVDSDLISSQSLVGVTIPLATAEKDYWTINVTQFGVESSAVWTGKPCRNGGCMGIVDSGTSFLSMPKSVFQLFASTYLLPGNCVYKSAYYVCPKTISLPRLSLQFGENSSIFYLNSWDYSLVYSENEIIVQIQMTPTGRLGDRWIIGDTFLKVYYTTYNVKEKQVIFYCKNGQCNGGDNVLDFSPKATSWAIILIIIGSSLVGISILGLGAYCCAATDA
ncbi:gastricsin [Thraustotheca clavata]|uniref:Gastricsin n=1 Tax=Thraustotheca clavata TaxID=74557 RepID=A0A1V9Y737_9STRA|nr:gastricsin [Thraustotheca clavata]